MDNKREVPSSLKKILNSDIKLTTKFVKFIDTKYGPIKNYKGIFRGLEISCHGIPWMVITAATLFLLENQFIRQLMLNIFIALLFDITVVAILKAISRRRRPSGNENDMFATYLVDKFSFPSGHATRATLLTCLIASQYNVFFPITLLMTTWSVSICISRVLFQRHYLLDVIGGIVVGYLQATFISNFIWLSVDSSNAVVSYFLNEVVDGPSFDV